MFPRTSDEWDMSEMPFPRTSDEWDGFDGFSLLLPPL